MTRALSLGAGALFCLALASGARAQEPLYDRTLTLDDSVRLTLNNSQSLLSAREDTNIAMQRVREAQALFFPKLDLNANWSKFRVEDDVPMLLQPGLGPTLIGSSPRENYYTARANILQTVYEGGRSRNTWRQARISYERARSIHEALQIELAAGAKKAFYDLLLAQDRRREYARLVETLEPTLARLSGGRLSERMRLEDAWQDLRSRAAEAAFQEDEARLAYLRTLNLELNTNVLLKGRLETQPVELDLQKLVAWSTQSRPELRQTEYQQELDALGISLSLAERTPTVAFGASYERAGHDAELERANWAGTLNINLPISISDMVYGWAKVRGHRSQYRQATLKHAETADHIQLEVRQAYAKYRHWQEELAPREAAYRRIGEMAEQLRREGPGAAERLDAERTLLEARLRYEEAVHGHLSALASIERAVGRSLTSEQ